MEYVSNMQRGNVKSLNFMPHEPYLRITFTFTGSYVSEWPYNRLSLQHKRVKVKLRFTLEQVTKAQRGSRCIALPFL